MEHSTGPGSLRSPYLRLSKTGNAMPAKLLILNNGLKNLRGHYFETAVSIADAARKCGYQPILAAHVSCPRDIIPDWLEFYPIFCTDHWMNDPAPPPPALDGLRGDAVAQARVPFEAVREGKATVADYLRARFEPINFPEQLPIPEASPEDAGTTRGSIKDALPALVPPYLDLAFHWLAWRRRMPIQIARRILRGISPPGAYAGLRWLKRRLLHQAPDLPAWAAVQETAPVVAPQEDPLKVQLHRVQSGAEFDHLGVFQRDLERFLCLTGADSRDHVFLPTAHGRELIAIQRLIGALDPLEPPTFHLEFRHAMDMTGCFDDPNWIHPYIIYHRAFFDYYRRWPHHARIKLYTDTEDLTEQYERFSGLSFATLPIPFRSGFVTARTYRPKEPLCITFLGDVRDEKGFYWLPDLVEGLMEDYILPGKVRFRIQGTLVHPEWDRKSHAALVRLKQMPAEQVTLVGLDKALSPEAYYDLLSKSEILLCPYSPFAYRCRSSGTLAEAIAAGIPTVVPRGTWLERQQAPGTGEAFSDLASLVEGVRRICDDYPRYLSRSQAHREHWLAIHSPENLVYELVSTARNERKLGPYTIPSPKGLSALRASEWSQSQAAV